MHDFTERQINIIRSLTNVDEFLPGKILADENKCSIRTIQNDIQSINLLIPGLIVSSNKGYILRIEKIDTNSFLETSKHYEKEILKDLLLDNKKQHIYDLSIQYFHSVSTIEAKLKSFIPILEEYNLTLNRNRFYVSIQGNELNKRDLIRHLILQEIKPGTRNIDNFQPYFEKLDLFKIKEFVKMSVERNNYLIEETYLSNIVLNLAIAFHRIRTNSYIEDVVDDFNRDGVEYRIAETVCALYENHWNITIMNNDIAYIASFFFGQIKPNFLVTDSLLLTYNEYKIKNIVLKCLNSYFINIEINDSLESFVLHIQSLLIRSHFNNNVKNDILYSLKNHSPFIYEIAVNLAKELSKEFSLKIIDDEIGFLGIHLGYLIDHSYYDSQKLTIALVSNEYMKTIDRLEVKLEELFGNNIRILKMSSGFNQPNGVNIDLIISTNELFILGMKVITISPFLVPFDIARVSEGISHALEYKQKQYHQKLMRSFFHENLFFIDNTINTKEEAIQFLGSNMEDFGIVNDKFISSVFEREELSSTCFFDLFSIPHSLEMNSNKTMFAVLINPDGIQWDTNKISIVLLISIDLKHRRNFVNIYEGIIKTLSDPIKIEEIKRAKSFEDFMHLLEFS